MSSPSGDSGSADGKSAAARRAELRRRRVQEKMERRLRVAKGEEAPLRPAAAPAAPGSDSTVKTAPVTRRKHVAPPPPPRQPRATAPSDGGAASTQSTSSTAPPKGADADGKEVPLDAARLAGTLASSPADSLRAKVHRVKFARLLTLMRTLLVALCGAMLGELLAGCASEAGLWHVASNPTEEDPKDWFEEWEAVEDAPADMLDELVRSGDDDFVEEDDLFVDAPGMAGGVEEFPTVNVTGVCRLTVLPIPLVPLALVLARVLGTALEGALQRWKFPDAKDATQSSSAGDADASRTASVSAPSAAVTDPSSGNDALSMLAGLTGGAGGGWAGKLSMLAKAWRILGHLRSWAFDAATFIVPMVVATVVHSLN